VEDENMNETNDGGALRKQLEKVLADNKALTEKLTGLEAKERIRSVESVLVEKGLNPKLAKFVPAEDGVDPARMDNWIKENAELFGTPAGSGEGEQLSGQPSVDPGTAQAFKQIQQVSQNGAHAVTDASAVLNQMKSAKDPAAFEALMAQYRGA
jgi:hypothetical protein